MNPSETYGGSGENHRIVNETKPHRRCHDDTNQSEARMAGAETEVQIQGRYVRKSCLDVVAAGKGSGELGASERSSRAEAFELQDPAQEIRQSQKKGHQQKMLRVPQLVREFGAEALGTFLLVYFGDGAIAQIALGGRTFGNFLSIALGYGLALMIGITVSGGVSGGHLNPAVTLTMAAFRRLSWIQLTVYWIAQYIGAFLAAALLYGIYYDGITAAGKHVPETAGIFASYPTNVFPTSMTTLVFDQILGTAMLLIIIFAITDKNNLNVSKQLIPIYIGLGLTAIHLSFGLNAGCAINPARDFSPRFLTLIAGWQGATFGTFSWIPFLMPHIGGLLGGAMYWFLIGMHFENDDQDDQ